MILSTSENNEIQKQKQENMTKKSINVVQLLNVLRHLYTSTYIYIHIQIFIYIQ